MQVLNNDTDREWEKFGRADPYFGVLSHDKFRGRYLTEEHKKEFFGSGSTYIDDVLKRVSQHFGKGVAIKNALDFGCGVGRLLIPLARHATTVTGVDVSESMLLEARKNCEERSIKNVVLLKSDDDLSLVDGKYDFIHSFIVFQHIPPRRGELIFKRLLSHLEDEGVCVVHFTYAKQYAIRKVIQSVRSIFPLSGSIANLLRGRKVFSPQMQMNNYNLNRLFYLVQNINIRDCYVEFTNHYGELGVILLFKKQAPRNPDHST